MSIYSSSIKELNRLKLEIVFYKQQISELPEGYLTTSKRKDSYVMYHNIGGHKKYISKSQLPLAKKLAKKSYYKIRLCDVENEVRAINAYLKIHKEQRSQEYLEKHDRFAGLIENGFEDNNKHAKCLYDALWIDKIAKDYVAYKLFVSNIITDEKGNRSWNYEGSNNALYQEKRVIRTNCGIYVRSKSEAMIANELFAANIIFVYEPELIIDGKIFYPDFLILHPIDGIAVILEHGGLFIDRNNTVSITNQEWSNSVNYTHSFATKLQIYIKNGWIPGINLIITSETKRKPFDSTVISGIIENMLLK